MSLFKYKYKAVLLCCLFTDGVREVFELKTTKMSFTTAPPSRFALALGDRDITSSILDVFFSGIVFGHAGILFIIRTRAAYYDTRLPAIMDTWGAEVLKSEANDLMIFGNERREKDPKIQAVNCADNHGEGLCCKTAIGFMEAFEYGKDKFSWFFVLDDDHYVHQENLVKSLASHDASEPMGLGIPLCGGCGPNDTPPGGFCGGGGYALSMAAVRKLMMPSTDAFFEDYMSHLGTGNHSDVTTACSLRRHNISVGSMKGLHGWQLKGNAVPNTILNGAYLEEIASTNPLPITFHYVSPAMIRAIHQQFVSPVFSKTAGSLLQDRESKYDEKVQCYISKVNAQRQALLSNPGNATMMQGPIVC